MSAFKIDSRVDNFADVTIVVATTQGRRRTMEDQYDIRAGYAAAFDGHSGAAAAEWAAQNLYNYIGADLEQTFIRADSVLRGVIPDASGTTVSMVTYKRIDDAWQVTTAHVGDSPIIIIPPTGEPVITQDHTPELEMERARIYRAGMTVTFNGCWRVHGNLAVSRAIGDFRYKQPDLSAQAHAITVIPEIAQHAMKPGTRVVIATDGLFETLSQDDVIAQVHASRDIASTATLLVDQALKGSRDNITVLIMQLGDVDELARTRPSTPV